MTDRRRNGLILLLVAGLIAASAVVIATKKTRLGLDLKGGVELVYQAKPTPPQPKVTQDAVNRSIDIMRERVDQLGVSEPEIQRSGRDQIAVGLPDVKNAQRAQKQVGKVAQLFFYDWETNVLGPDVKPNPATPTSPAARRPARSAACPLYDAVKRASKRPPIHDDNNTTNDQYYLFVRPRQHRLICRPGGHRGRPVLRAAAPAQAAEHRGRQGQHRARSSSRASSPTRRPRARPTRYFVLNDNPALNGHRHQEPRAELRPGRGRRRGADRHVRVHRQGAQEVAERDARDRPARPLAPGARASRPTRPSSTSRRCSTTRSSPRRSSPTSTTRTGSTGARARRSRAASRSRGAGPRQAAQDRRPADQARADLAVAGLGDAGQGRRSTRA